MPTYEYETIPTNPDEVPLRFEVRQSMNEPALRVHPESGVPVRRVISGGLGYMQKGAPGTAASGGGHSHAPGCSCCG